MGYECPRAGTQGAGPRGPRAVHLGANLHGGAFPTGTPWPQLQPTGSPQSQRLREALERLDVRLVSWRHGALPSSPGHPCLGSWAATIASPSVQALSCVSGTEGTEGRKKQGSLSTDLVWGRCSTQRQIILFREPYLPREPCKDARPGAPGRSARVTDTSRKVCSVSPRCVRGGLSRTVSSTVWQRGEESAFTQWAVTRRAGTWGRGQGM